MINSDGTIQSAFERWLGLVLGVDARGDVVWTHHSNAEQRLRLDTHSILTTGMRDPVSEPTRLLLGGRWDDRAVVLAGRGGNFRGNDFDFATIGPVERAVRVHLEANGGIRLADRPSLAFGCMHGVTDAGGIIQIYLEHDAPHQRFVVNQDATISPRDNRHVVWGMSDIGLRLVNTGIGQANAITVSDEVGQRLGRSCAPEPAAGRQCQARKLTLASHPGMALSVDCPDDSAAGAGRFAVVPARDAKRLIVEDDHFRLEGKGAVILGLGPG